MFACWPISESTGVVIPRRRFKAMVLLHIPQSSCRRQRGVNLGDLSDLKNTGSSQRKIYLARLTRFPTIILGGQHHEGGDRATKTGFAPENQSFQCTNTSSNAVLPLSLLLRQVWDPHKTRRFSYSWCTWMLWGLKLNKSAHATFHPEEISSRSFGTSKTWI